MLSGLLTILMLLLAACGGAQQGATAGLPAATAQPVADAPQITVYHAPT
jgi:hypothetical protein